MELLQSSPAAWLDCVLANFDSFLLDHASAERKASAMAVSFVVQYPDRFALHQPMIRLAREELLHYQQVMALIEERGLLWERDEKDLYIRELMGRMRTDRDGRFLDRLLMGAVVEARGVERFGLVGEGLDDPELARFYQRLSRSEATHTDLFEKMARRFFPAQEVSARLEAWLNWEAQAILEIPIRPLLH